MMKQIVLITCILFGFSCDAPSKLAPEIESTLIDGSSFKLSDLKGQYVVLDFWGSWCGPCLVEMPKLVELNGRYEDRVTIVSVALEKGGTRWKTASEKFGMNWKYQLVEESKIVLASSIARAYGVADIPATFVIDPKGELVGQMNIEQIDAFLEASLN